jgi:hypothetical protein
MGSRTRMSRFVTPPANLPDIHPAMGETSKLSEGSLLAPDDSLRRRALLPFERYSPHRDFIASY